MAELSGRPQLLLLLMMLSYLTYQVLVEQFPGQVQVLVVVQVHVDAAAVLVAVVVGGVDAEVVGLGANLSHKLLLNLQFNI